MCRLAELLVRFQITRRNLIDFCKFTFSKTNLTSTKRKVTRFRTGRTQFSLSLRQLYSTSVSNIARISIRGVHAATRPLVKPLNTLRALWNVSHKRGACAKLV